MATSIQDVAREAGVSISTVSRSFTRPDLVSAKTRERVLAIADKLNFSLSRSAAALKSGRSLRIAVLMSGHIRLWFTASVIEGLNEVLHTQGYDISVFQISSIKERKEFFEMLPVRRNADAVIVASFDIDNNEIAQLASVGVPIVGINSVEPEARGFTAAVNIDDVQGSTLAPPSYQSRTSPHHLHQHQSRGVAELLRAKPIRLIHRLLPQGRHRAAGYRLQGR